MRIEKDRFQARLKEALSESPGTSDEFEAVLFSRAEDLLSKRREQIASREAEARQIAQVGKRWLLAIRQAFLRTLEGVALHPDRPATAAVLAALVAAFLALHGGGREMSVQLSYADLPPLPKSNDFPARYDAQIRAERESYEREVQDAHRKTSGGI
ncbi:MAG: hypothetical protein A2X94_04560 [Bdellovibrionales bacterium GWB1_55_8]|nr:MAG: hypothetical protein A2X94_04560 [Bdellovibrionales bacterium GWB1_55_8]